MAKHQNPIICRLRLVKTLLGTGLSSINDYLTSLANTTDKLSGSKNNHRNLHRITYSPEDAAHPPFELKDVNTPFNSSRMTGGPEPEEQLLDKTVLSSCELQLELIRQSLDLETVALLWTDSENNKLHLSALASKSRDILRGPYPLGGGITGAFLRETEEIAVAPVKSSFCDIPYYRNKKNVGGFFAIKIPQQEPASQNNKSFGILCVDRPTEILWSDKERNFLRLSAEKLSLETNIGRWLANMEQEKRAIQGACIGLCGLNKAQGLEPVFDATIKAVKALVDTDFLAISLLQGETHKVVRTEASYAQRFLEREFPKGEGLIGQVLKLNSSLPAGAEYRGPAPVFSQSEKLSGYRSLLIVPLRKEDGSPIGALTVAAKKPGVFTRSKQSILELIATQVGIKIDLGQAHDQINRLATTDGLTELANHRTFQHAFNVMLHRANRQNNPLCLILCDIDHFKKINDTYGHPFGDQVLKTVAKTLAGTVRVVDLAARYGGEEFAVLLEDSDEEGGKKMAERIRKQIESLSLQKDQKTVNLTISLGIATFPKDSVNKDDLISYADQALYAAKKRGRNCSKTWSELNPAILLRD